MRIVAVIAVRIIIIMTVIACSVGVEIRPICEERVIKCKPIHYMYLPYVAKGE